MPEPLLTLDHLTVSFPGPGRAVEVVQDLSLAVPKGQTLGLVGESGSGKSMTALAVLGLVPAPGRVKGSIRFEGRELLGMNEMEYSRIRGGAIAIVFQDPATALNPVFTVEEQMVESIMLHRRVNRREARAMAIQSLQHVEIPNPGQRLQDYPHQFSGGMKQRIMIAMALACEPACLILDEPTTALDVTIQAQILDLIERIQHENNLTIILISHDLGIISEIADEVAVLYAGQLMEQGSVPDILRHPRHPYTQGLIESIPKLGHPKTRLHAITGMPPNPAALPEGCVFNPRCSRRLESCLEKRPPQSSWDSQLVHCWNPEPEPRHISEAQPSGKKEKNEKQTSDILLSVTELGRDYFVKTARYAGLKQRLVAVDRVTLAIPSGKIIGLVGESGSGKSTLSRMAAALEEPSRGRIEFDGQPLHALKGEALRALRKRFQPVFQDHYGSLNPRMTVRETIEEPLILHGRPHAENDLTELLEQAGLGPEVLGRYPHQLSGGQRQRLGLARALAVRPDLLIADEPLSSLDVSIQAQVLNLLMDLQEKHHLTMLVVSHDLRVVGHVADRVAVMYAGRIMEWAASANLYQNPRHPYTRALLAALPKLQPGRGRVRTVLKGDIPSSVNPGPGCRFYSRCAFRTDACQNYDNAFFHADAGHEVACLRWQELPAAPTGEFQARADTNA